MARGTYAPEFFHQILQLANLRGIVIVILRLYL